MMVERKKYSEVNMWNKIKWVVIGISIGWMFYLNYQTNQQMRDRVDRIDVQTSHHRTDIIGLKGDYDALGVTMTFHRNEIDISNTIFRKDLLEDVEHELGMMESKLKMLDEDVETFAVEYRMKEQMIRETIFNISAATDTLRKDGVQTLIGRKTLQEQIDQLRLEFDELIQKLEEHKRTKDIFQ
jgi:hypothetical protein